MRNNIAELLGTFMLVFSGTCAIAANTVDGGAEGLVGIALAFGLSVLAMIYAIGDVSGAHINPAVTIGLCLARRIPVATALPYIFCQCAGALLASLLVHVLFPNDPAYLGATLPGTGISLFQCFVLETVTTFFLVFVILNVTTGGKEKGIMAGIAISSVIVLDILFAGPICGASMNPARSLGPALVSGHLEHLWLYLTAPVLGAGLAVLACDLIRERPHHVPETRLDTPKADGVQS